MKRILGVFVCLLLGAAQPGGGTISVRFFGSAGVELRSASTAQGGAIEVTAFHESAAAKAIAPPEGKSAGTAGTSAVSFTIPRAATRALLQEALMQGKAFPKVVFEFTKRGAGTNEVFETITLTDAIVASVRATGTGNSASQPSEEITLVYRAMQTRYTGSSATRAPSTSTTTGYDIQKAKPQ